MSLNDVFSLLEALSTTHGISGWEHHIAEKIKTAVVPLSDECKTDALGNVIAVKYGAQTGKKSERIRLMIAAHMDEIGLLVSGIHEQGFLHVTPIGGVDRSLLFAKEVYVHTAQGKLPGLLTTRPPHLTTAEERKKLPSWDEFFVDVGLPYDELVRTVQIGDMITLRSRCERLGDTGAAGKAFDNRAGVAALVVCMQYLQRWHHEVDVYAVTTVQEEVGLRGAMTATFGVAPHVGIAVDVTVAKQPGISDAKGRKMGAGPSVAQGPNIHPMLFNHLIHTAKQNNIPHQTEVYAGNTQTDAWAMQITRDGVPTALLSIPLAHMHSTVERLDLRDIQTTARLLAHYVSSADLASIGGWQRVVT